MMGYRFVNSGKFMPAGLVATLRYVGNISLVLESKALFKTTSIYITVCLWWLVLVLELWDLFRQKITDDDHNIHFTKQTFFTC